MLLKDFAAAEDGRNNDLLKIRLEIDSLAEKGYGKKSKESSNAKYRLGRIYRVLGDYKTAEFYYKECIKMCFSSNSSGAATSGMHPLMARARYVGP